MEKNLIKIDENKEDLLAAKFDNLILRIKKLEKISKELVELFYTADENDLEIHKMLYDAVVNVDNVYSVYKERYMIARY